jgi:hypothetical protein
VNDQSQGESIETEENVLRRMPLLPMRHRVDALRLALTKGEILSGTFVNQDHQATPRVLMSFRSASRVSLIALR